MWYLVGVYQVHNVIDRSFTLNNQDFIAPISNLKEENEGFLVEWFFDLMGVVLQEGSWIFKILLKTLSIYGALGVFAKKK